MRILIAASSFVTCAVSAWMGVMYLVLRHPGYQLRALMAALICLGAASLLTGRPPVPLRLPIAVWGAALAVLGVLAFLAPGDDGWVIVAAAMFVVEGSLAILASVTSRRLA
jgi:hypothetical protein